GGYLDVRAQRGLRKGQRHLAHHVVALALEQRMGRNAHEHVQIAGRAAAPPGLALPANHADPAVGTAGWDLDQELALARQRALALALRARVGDQLALAPAGAAGLAEREEALPHADAAEAASGGAEP